ncbi:MAG: hypothetical protein ACYC27_02990 [Armatimonadota bacterium]
MERPIIFTAESVRAILDGRKTQTRRVIKPQPILWQCSVPGMQDVGGLEWKGIQYECDTPNDIETVCPYGLIGDELWVKETWWDFGKWLFYSIGDEVDYDHAKWYGLRETDELKPLYDADNPTEFIDCIGNTYKRNKSEARCGVISQFWRKCSPLFMKRWVSRIQLRITDLRVERVQEITEEDALAEGIGLVFADQWRNPQQMTDAIRKSRKDGYRLVWDSINAKRGYSWESNPWVWVVEFEKVAQVAPGEGITE